MKWLSDTIYPILDIIGEFEAEMDQLSTGKFSLKKHGAVMIPCLPIGPKYIRVKKMNLLREDLEKFMSEQSNFIFLAHTNVNELNVTDIRETTSYMGMEQIVGRTKEIDTILELLSESMTKEMLTILSIYGIGDLGKTTFAKMVYNSTQFEGYSRVWVYVSKTFDLMNIANSIITQLSDNEDESKYTEFEKIRDSLLELLADKKILIVLDDLCEREVYHLEWLIDMLKSGKESKVIVLVTTRDEDIAKHISTIQPYKLEPLTNYIL